MDRMRKFIAGYMVASVQTGTCSFIEVDVILLSGEKKIKYFRKEKERS
jgi:hypothetical protein